VLVGEGYRVTTLETAEAALELLEKDEVDLLVLDVKLPGISGIEALALLRRAPATRSIPVLAFTASVMPQDRSEIMAAGFDAFVSKPINLRAFLDAVAATLAPAGRTA
jgi:two-component system cell cycle response regulator DivK